MRIAVAGGIGTVGRRVVECAREVGHEVVVLSSSHGVDVRGRDGLAEALTGVGAVIDATKPDTIEQVPATKFFTDVAGALQCTGARLPASHRIAEVSARPCPLIVAKLSRADRQSTANPWDGSPARDR